MVGHIHRAGSLKQRNKPFKGRKHAANLMSAAAFRAAEKRKATSAAIAAAIRPTNRKERVLQTKHKRMHQAQRLQQLKQSLRGAAACGHASLPPKIVLVLSFNKDFHSTCVCRALARQLNADTATNTHPNKAAHSPSTLAAAPVEAANSRSSSRRRSFQATVLPLTTSIGGSPVKNAADAADSSMGVPEGVFPVLAGESAVQTSDAASLPLLGLHTSKKTVASPVSEGAETGELDGVSSSSCAKVVEAAARKGVSANNISSAVVEATMLPADAYNKRAATELSSSSVKSFPVEQWSSSHCSKETNRKGKDEAAQFSSSSSFSFSSSSSSSSSSSFSSLSSSSFSSCPSFFSPGAIIDCYLHALPSYACCPTLAQRTQQRLLLLPAPPPQELLQLLSLCCCVDLLVCVFAGDCTYDLPAFDDDGYRFLSALKMQGVPPVIGIGIAPTFSVVLNQNINQNINILSTSSCSSSSSASFSPSPSPPPQQGKNRFQQSLIRQNEMFTTTTTTVDDVDMSTAKEDYKDLGKETNTTAKQTSGNSRTKKKEDGESLRFQQRYFHSEFGPDKSFVSVRTPDDWRKVLRAIGNAPIPVDVAATRSTAAAAGDCLHWRARRGYLLAFDWRLLTEQQLQDSQIKRDTSREGGQQKQQVNMQQQQQQKPLQQSMLLHPPENVTGLKKLYLQVDGYVRGVGFTKRLPVHVTGVGDFLAQKIEVLSHVRAPAPPQSSGLLQHQQQRQQQQQKQQQQEQFDISCSSDNSSNSLRDSRRPDGAEIDMEKEEAEGEFTTGSAFCEKRNDGDSISTLIDDLSTEELSAAEQLQMLQCMQPLQPFDRSSLEQTWPTEAELLQQQHQHQHEEEEEEGRIEGGEPPMPHHHQQQQNAEGILRQQKQQQQQRNVEEIITEEEEKSASEDDEAEEEEDEESEKWWGEDLGGSGSNTEPPVLHRDNTKQKYTIEQRAAEDLEFPDEVDTPMDIEARMRFQKYRGLKSFRTSTWSRDTDLPVEYSRVVDFQRFKGMQNYAYETLRSLCARNIFHGRYCRITIPLHLSPLSYRDSESLSSVTASSIASAANPLAAGNAVSSVLPAAVPAAAAAGAPAVSDPSAVASAACASASACASAASAASATSAASAASASASAGDPTVGGTVGIAPEGMAIAHGSSSSNENVGRMSNLLTDDDDSKSDISFRLPLPSSAFSSDALWDRLLLHCTMQPVLYHTVQRLRQQLTGIPSIPPSLTSSFSSSTSVSLPLSAASTGAGAASAGGSGGSGAAGGGAGGGGAAAGATPPYLSSPFSSVSLSLSRGASVAGSHEAREQTASLTPLLTGVASANSARKERLWQPLPAHLVLSTVLPYETAVSVVHLSLTRGGIDSDIQKTSIKSKEELLFLCGFRRFIGRPTFSTVAATSASGSAAAREKAKYLAYFHPSSSCIASLYCCTMFPPTPVLVFLFNHRKQQQLQQSHEQQQHQPKDHQHRQKQHQQQLQRRENQDQLHEEQKQQQREQQQQQEQRHDQQQGICDIWSVAAPTRETGAVIGAWQICAWGSVLQSSSNRVILKRIILTGYPYRVHKRKAVIRYMFFNPRDIRWFMPVELQTKRGLRGNILQPLGTHGYMKCRFNLPLKQDDTVCMHLYKRVYPKWYPPAWYGPLQQLPTDDFNADETGQQQQQQEQPVLHQEFSSLSHKQGQEQLHRTQQLSSRFAAPEDVEMCVAA